MSTLFPHDLTPHPECHVLSIGLWNYKAARDIKLDLGRRLHLFVGDNGAGKTTILDGIAAGLASVVTRGGAKTSGDARVALSAETVYRRDGQPESQAGVTLQLGGGWCFDVLETERSDRPTSEGDAERWFRERWRSAESSTEGYLPVFCYYTADRASFFANTALKREDSVPGRQDALRGAFSAATSYSELVRWFASMERMELYEMRRRRDTNYRDPAVEAVRNAVRSVVPTVTELSYDPRAGLLQVETDTGAGHNRFTLDELSGGGRVMVALVADLARRMIQANPHLGLESPAVVLIDEVDLHLHPKWQATVVDDLMRTFPRAQFILSTHSEQVIGAVPSELVRSVRVTPDGVKAYAIGALEGASFERVLEDGMGLSSGRPQRHQDLLTRYWALVDGGEGESPEGLALRQRLDDLYQGHEPDLVRADVVIRRLRARRGTP